MNKRDLKIFALAFFAFLFASFVYNNFSTETVAKGITFKEIKVKIIGNVQLDLDCNGTVLPKGAKDNRGRGENTKNQCKGTGTFTAEFPQQRFVEKPDLPK